MTLELSMYFLSGVLFVVCCLVGVIWNQKNAEIKEHSRLIELKAGNDRLSELDNKIDRDMREMEKSNERLIEKLEQRQLRDIEIVSSGFREQVTSLKDAMNAMEKNILQQMSMLFHNQSK